MTVLNKTRVERRAPVGVHIFLKCILCDFHTSLTLMFMYYRYSSAVGKANSISDLLDCKVTNDFFLSFVYLPCWKMHQIKVV
jgi:hypothetical protein